jgi:hypothetical protein
MPKPYKLISLESALKEAKTKAGIAKKCGCSPAAVFKALEDMNKGLEVWRIRIWTSGRWELVVKQPTWRAVAGRVGA